MNISIDRRKKVVVFSSDNDKNACAVIRILSPLLKGNWDVTWISEYDLVVNEFRFADVQKADLVIVQRQFPSAYNAKLLRRILRLSIPIIYDLDDLFLDVPKSNPHFSEMNRRAPYIRWILEEADLVTVSTEPLMDYVRHFSNRPIRVNPNLVSWDLFDSSPKKVNDVFNFLVSGTATHRSDWSILEQPLLEIIASYPKYVNVIFFGELPSKFVNNPAVSFIDFEKSYFGYAERLRHLTVHAALVSLENNHFNLCKSNIKWLEYSVAGIPGVFSNIAPYSSSITNEKTGLLVNDSAESWYRAMDRMINDACLISEMINNARTEIFERYSVERVFGRYLDVFNDVVETGRHDRSSDDFSMALNGIRCRILEPIYKSRFMHRHVLWRFEK